MKRAIAASAVTLALLAGSALPAGAVLAPPANSRYELCNFDDPTVPRANRTYPFKKMLTTKTRRSSSANVRRAVRSVQEVLASQGFTNRVGGPVLVDGDYGPATAYAVKQFQRKMGLYVDGKVGKQTWRRLAVEYCWMYH